MDCAEEDSCLDGVCVARTCAMKPNFDHSSLQLGDESFSIGSEGYLQCEEGFVMRIADQCVIEQTVVCVSNSRNDLPKWISKNFASNKLRHCQRGTHIQCNQESSVCSERVYIIITFFL